MQVKASGWLVLGALLSIFAVQPLPAPAMCVAPELEPESRRVRSGSEIDITGKHWFTGCQDHGSCSSMPCGETECDYGPEERPTKDIIVSLMKNGEVVSSTVVDAEDDFTFSTTLEIPRGTRPGRYRLRAEYVGGGPIRVLAPNEKK